MASKDRVKLRRNLSRKYIIGSISVALGLVFFLTSGFYMQEELEVLSSPVGEDIRVTSGTSTEIIEWKYDESENEMEVILDMTDYRQERDNIHYAARQRSDLSEVTVEKVLDYEEYVVLRISDIDEEFLQIALQITRENDDILEEDFEVNDTESEQVEDLEEENNHLTTLYMDYREIENGEIMVEEGENDVEYITSLLIERSEKNIEEMNEELTKIDQAESELNQDIEELNFDKQYQTSEEEVQTDNQINALEIQKDELKTERERTQEEINIEEERIDNLIKRERDSSLSYNNH